MVTAQNDKKKILIVEDNDDLRELLNLQLNLNYRVFEATNGQEAIDILETNEIDLILMDISMPVLDGLEATRLIRKNNKIMPIVICSAHKNTHHEEAFSIGCNDFMVKPIDTKMLMATIERQLRTR